MTVAARFGSVSVTDWAPAVPRAGRWDESGCQNSESRVSSGEVCVQHAKLSDPLPELSSGSNPDAAAGRVLGHNAARIVVGLPLKPDD
ncbi:glycerol dehydratase reactivase beta/small subunit family protein [Mycobacteriaceae bacterium Msp059]|nr:glycerol dehydratase reactivase beta/small subunit family protein [Mycobacteriaceae bacterium Msp059]